MRTAIGKFLEALSTNIDRPSYAGFRAIFPFGSLSAVAAALSTSFVIDGVSTYGYRASISVQSPSLALVCLLSALSGDSRACAQIRGITSCEKERSFCCGTPVSASKKITYITPDVLSIDTFTIGMMFLPRFSRSSVILAVRSIMSIAEGISKMPISHDIYYLSSVLPFNQIPYLHKSGAPHTSGADL